MAIVGIIGAMEEELDYILKAMQLKGTSTGAGLKFYSGTYESVDLIVVKSGIGKVNAALCTQKLISDYSVSCIINTGIAGGIAQGLKVLDQVVSTNVVHHDVDATAFGYPKGTIPQMSSSVFNADMQLRQIALEVHQKGDFSNNIIEGRIASGDVFVASTEQKHQIQKEFDALCVEMEGAAIAQVCHLNSVPFLILRCISDLADEKADITYEELTVKAADLSSRLVLGIVSQFAKDSAEWASDTFC